MKKKDMLLLCQKTKADNVPIALKMLAEWVRKACVEQNATEELLDQILKDAIANAKWSKDHIDALTAEAASNFVEAKKVNELTAKLANLTKQLALKEKTLKKSYRINHSLACAIKAIYDHSTLERILAATKK